MNRSLFFATAFALASAGCDPAPAPTDTVAKPDPQPPSTPPETPADPAGKPSEAPEHPEFGESTWQLGPDGTKATAMDTLTRDLRGLRFPEYADAGTWDPNADRNMRQWSGLRGKRVPRVRRAKATVDGSLDKNVIRRIVRSRVTEVRTCYFEGLKADPNAQGRVEVRFTVEPDGKVSASELKGSTLSDADVGACIAKLPLGWKFPTSDSATTVLYPFDLSPG